MNAKAKKTLKVSLITLGSILGVFVITVGSYVGYVAGSYYRIEDNVKLDVKQRSELEKIETNKDLTFTSYNVGFGAYSPDFSFFLSKGIDNDGSKLVGEHSKAISKEDVTSNINGSINLIKSLNSDFYAIQEVDEDSDRAYHIDERKLFEDSHLNYSSTYTENYHSSYLCWPLTDPHGKSNSGMVTLSKYKLNDPVRHSLTISTSFDKFFDLDRCFSSHYIDVDNNKKLCLVNIHMSAYDKGGIIRNKQVHEIKDFIEKEYENGNYVVVAGDFNHDLLTYNPMYDYTEENRCFNSEYKQQVPQFVSNIFNDEKESPFGDNFTIYADDKNPSMRGGDRAYKSGYTYINTFDGFIVSKNVEVKKVETTNAKDKNVDRFAYSDHQPTTLTFKLK